jgi:hypothetical protein
VSVEDEDEDELLELLELEELELLELDELDDEALELSLDPPPPPQAATSAAAPDADIQPRTLRRPSSSSAIRCRSCCSPRSWSSISWSDMALLSL